MAKLEYEDPENVLRRIEPFIRGLLQDPTSVEHLSKSDRKNYLETYQGAYLAMFLKLTSGKPAKVSICFAEDLDFDCVIRDAISTGEVVYKPVQLKQLPSSEKNPTISLQDIISKLAQLADSADLIVGIWINRDVRFDLKDLDFSELTIGQLWMFGDSVEGPLELHGGAITDWKSGHCWECRVKNLQPKVQRVKFR